MDALFARLRRLGPAADPDGPLLARYAATGDETAFAELVRRHGPLVWAAARRRLPDPADAADVFQATFLVLARKGPRLAGRPTVGPWLYRVAALTARNLRRRNAVRATLPAGLNPAARPEPDPALRWDLDDALLALTERDRAAVVLCHLEGYTRREAAERLGVPEGTLSAALHRALRKLRARLGDPLPLAAGGALPAGMAAATCQAAVVVRVAALSGAATPGVVQLTRGALRMFWLKKLVAGGLAAAACLGLGAGVGLAPRPAAVAAADPPEGKPSPPASDVDRLEALRRLAAEADRRAKTLAADLAREEARDRERRAVAAKAPKPPFIRLEVSDENRPWDAFIRLTETDAAGAVVAAYGCGGGRLGEASLATHLRRARLDPAGPREVVLEVSPKLDAADLCLVAQTVRDAGFPTVTYTGWLPEEWSVGKTQKGDRTQTWTGRKEVKGERVELGKVLPLDPPAGGR